MRGFLIVALSFLSSSVFVQAQVSSSANLSCTLVADSAIGCNGIGADPRNEVHKLPKLFVTYLIVRPGVAFERPSTSSDVLIIGINGGDLLNEKTPFLHVSLANGEVTLMPKEQAFRLRNTTDADVEFRLVEIQR